MIADSTGLLPRHLGHRFGTPAKGNYTPTHSFKHLFDSLAIRESGSEYLDKIITQLAWPLYHPAKTGKGTGDRTGKPIMVQVKEFIDTVASSSPDKLKPIKLNTYNRGYHGHMGR